MQRLKNRHGVDQLARAGPGVLVSSSQTLGETGTRLVSAIVLGTITLGLVFAGPLAFALLVTVFVGVLAWEWGRLVCSSGIDAAVLVQTGTAGAAAVLAANDCPACGLLVIIIGTASVFLLRRLQLGVTPSWWSATGVYYGGLPALALVWIRADPTYGLSAVLFLFIIVWTTDSAAYVFGRLIGGPALAPAISPKKTWAGFLAGLGFSTILGTVFVAGVIGTDALWVIIALSGLLSLLAQLGDLGASALKRRFGRKDSSGLIPGHGGVLDRVDGLIIAALACACLALLRDPAAPGRALLIWG
jgi:phosphatidate cytidylyltransferase